MEFTFRVIGALGLIFITIGVITKDRKKQNIYFIIGGVLLESYSIYLRDIIFIPLQPIFISAAIYDLHHLKTNKH